MCRISGVICDIDGTLIDSNEAHARAFVQAFAEHGLTVPYDKVRWLIGKGGDKLIPEASGIAKDTETFQAISDSRKEIYLRDYVPHLKPTTGAAELLERLRAEGFQIVMATSGEDDVEVALRQVGLWEFFEVKASGKDATHSKPDPDIVQAALHRAQLSAENAVMLGDTPYDIQAAAQAGLSTIALLTGGWQRDALAQALAIYDSPGDLLAHFDQFRLPLKPAG